MLSRFARSTWIRLTALALPVALLLSACASGTRQDALKPAGPIARKLHNLVLPVFGVAGVVFVLIEGLVLFAVFKYRRRSDDEAPRQIHGNAKLELAWTVVPALLLVFVGFFTVKTLFDLSERPKSADTVHVDVTGHQWWWEYRYTDPGVGVVTANELHIPARRPVDLALTSADVIHNYWPPQLAGKVYAIPGRVNHMTVQADKPGTYYGQCAEFCGLSHANMRLRVVAHDPQGWEQWVKANQAGSNAPAGEDDAATGYALFRQRGCSGCHTVQGYSAGTVGPNLTHLQQRSVFAGSMFDLNDVNLRVWLRNPPAEKPGSKMPNLNLSEDDITKLIAYLDTLK